MQGGRSLEGITFLGFGWLALLKEQLEPWNDSKQSLN